MRVPLRFALACVAIAAACGGKVERQAGTANGPSTPVIPAPGWGGAAGTPSDPPPEMEPPREPDPLSTECPVTPPNGSEQCAVAPDTPCTYVWQGGWERCHCPAAAGATRIWECEMCSGCNCPADLPDTGDSCADHPGATPCPSIGIYGYCSCSPALIWECSLEPGGVGGANG